MKAKKTFTYCLFFLLAIAFSSCSKDRVENKIEIPFEKFVLPNGLQVVLHVDHSDPVISYTVMYHVGSSREETQRTGFAHLYEHLLFQGSENVARAYSTKLLKVQEV